MADLQRIHPSSAATSPPSSRPTAPLFPPTAAKSDNTAHPPPPPYSRPPPRRRCRRVCCCLCCTAGVLLLLLVLLVGVFAAVLFLGFHPKIPHYSIDGIRVAALNVSAAAGLSATFDVNLTARNPNKKIGIFYTSGSHLTVFYNLTELCHGSLPVFYQGHRNTTVMQVPLSGETPKAAALFAQMMAAQQEDGGVPLLIRGKVPVRIKMGKLKLMKMKFKARCNLVVDGLSANSKGVSIKSSSCKIKLHSIF